MRGSVDELRGLGTFDVITLWHSFEHMTDPTHELDRMLELLAGRRHADRRRARLRRHRRRACSAPAGSTSTCRGTSSTSARRAAPPGREPRAGRGRRRPPRDRVRSLRLAAEHAQRAAADAEPVLQLAHAQAAAASRARAGRRRRAGGAAVPARGAGDARSASSRGAARRSTCVARKPAFVRRLPAPPSRVVAVAWSGAAPRHERGVACGRRTVALAVAAIAVVAVVVRLWKLRWGLRGRHGVHRRAAALAVLPERRSCRCGSSRSCAPTRRRRCSTRRSTAFSPAAPRRWLHALGVIPAPQQDVFSALYVARLVAAAASLANVALVGCARLAAGLAARGTARRGADGRGADRGDAGALRLGRPAARRLHDARAAARVPPRDFGLGVGRARRRRCCRARVQRQVHRAGNARRVRLGDPRGVRARALAAPAAPAAAIAAVGFLACWRSPARRACCRASSCSARSGAQPHQLDRLSRVLEGAARADPRLVRTAVRLPARRRHAVRRSAGRCTWRVSAVWSGRCAGTGRSIACCW